METEFSFWPETQRTEYNPQTEGRCFVCGRWYFTRRRICIHNSHDMLICWICPDCEVLPCDKGTTEHEPHDKRTMEHGTTQHEVI